MRKLPKIVVALTVVFGAWSVSPSSGAAQSCAGMPGGSGAAYAGLAFESEPQWGVEGGHTGSGTVGARARYLWEPPVDDPSVLNERHTVSLLSAVRMSAGSVSVCPVAGLELESRVLEPSNREIWSVPLGLGLGWEVGVDETVTLRPFLLPQAVYVTGRPDLERVTDETGDSQVVDVGVQKAVDGRLDLGVVLEAGRLYGGAVVRVQAEFEALDGTDVQLERPLLLTVGWTF